MFNHIIPHAYAPLQPRNYYWDSAGDLLRFNQREFFDSDDSFQLSSFDDTGYVYIPKSCQQS